MKKKTVGTNPRSSNQLKRRTMVGRLSKYYTFTLTDAERSAWATYAATNPVINRLGNTTFLSAQQMFSKLNATYSGLAIAPNVLPPASNAVGTPVLITITPTADPGGSLIVQCDTLSPSSPDSILFWLSPPMNPGRTFIGSQLRKVPGAGARDTAIDLTASYEALFGALPTAPGQRIFVRCKVVNTSTGIASAFLQETAIWA